MTIRRLARLLMLLAISGCADRPQPSALAPEPEIPGAPEPEITASATAAPEQVDAGSVGGLLPGPIRAVVMSNVRKARACYDDLDAGAIVATVIIGWTIASDGTTHDEKIASSHGAPPALEQCLLKVVHAYVFPKSSAQTIIVQYPFKFGVSH